MGFTVKNGTARTRAIYSNPGSLSSDYHPADRVREARLEFRSPTDTPFESATLIFRETETAFESAVEDGPLI
jgi:hypothetical protein